MHAIHKINQKQHGNALFLILIAVALFAALSYAITQTSRGGGSITKETNMLAARGLVEYATQLRITIDRMRITNNCSDTEISFEHDGTSVYDNPSSPADGRCQVFHTNGGGMDYRNAHAEALLSGASGTWVFNTANEVIGVGTDCSGNACTELVAQVSRVKRDVCLEINNRLGVDNPSGEPPDESDIITGGFFTGTYSYGALLGDAATELQGEFAGCLYESTNVPAYYVYYHSLIER